MSQAAFYSDIAEGHRRSAMHSLQQVRAVHSSKMAADICTALIKKLDIGDIQDRSDLTAYTSNVSSIQYTAALLHDAHPQNCCDWALPLLRECYHLCSIQTNSRVIFTRKASGPCDYTVHIDVLRDKLPSSVDIFSIPHTADFDVASIAVVGHEVGHILCKEQAKNFERVIKKYLCSNMTPVKPGQQFNLQDTIIFREFIGKLSCHLNEHLCDLIGSSLLGPAFDLALLRIFLTDPNPNAQSKSHPAVSYRMYLAYNRILEVPLPESGSLATTLQTLRGVLEPLCKEYAAYSPDSMEMGCSNLANEIFADILKPKITHVNINDAWAKVAPELNGFRPPCETVTKDYPEPIRPVEIVLGTSLYYYGEAFEKNDFYVNSSFIETVKKKKLQEILANHVMYAIELSEFVRNANAIFREKDTDGNACEKLSKTLWHLRIKTTQKINNGLIVTPTIAPSDQYSLNSIDLRLGNSFLINRATRFTHISPHEISANEEEYAHFEFGLYEKINVPVGKQFILHPHQFVLACTLEYVCLPYDLYAFVLGRSTWGRLGLNIATATTVQAGFRGCLTLELRNLGETPLPLTVGTRIAQLSVVPAPPEIASKDMGYYAANNKYIGPVCAGLPKIQEDNDWAVLKDFLPSRS